MKDLIPKFFISKAAIIRMISLDSDIIFLQLALKCLLCYQGLLYRCIPHHVAISIITVDIEKYIARLDSKGHYVL